MISVPPAFTSRAAQITFLKMSTMLQGGPLRRSCGVSSNCPSALIDAIDNRNITVAALSGRAILELMEVSHIVTQIWSNRNGKDSDSTRKRPSTSWWIHQV